MVQLNPVSRVNDCGKKSDPMNKREILYSALQHKDTRPVPYDISFTEPARNHMAAYYGDPEFESKIGNYFTWVRPHPGNVRYREVKPDHWEDEFGVVWDRRVDKDVGVVSNRVVHPGNLDQARFPDPHDPSRYEFINSIIGSRGEKNVLASWGFALFERAWSMTGMQNLLMYMLSEPDFVHALLDRILEVNLGIIEHTCSLDIDIFRFGDDYGQQNGLIMGADLFRKFLKPRIRMIYQAVKEKGKYVMLHSCGRVTEILPDLIECGLDIFNPLQPEVMDIFEIKREFGRELSFFGGISVQRTLPLGTVEDTVKEVNLLLERLGKDGGYIASPSHEVPGDARPENVAAMIEVLQNQ